MASRTDGTERPGPTGRSVVDAFLSTDPRDAGCQQTWELIHVYAELVLAGGDPEETMPGLTAHLRACPPCAGDHDGLLNALMTAHGFVAGTVER